eukprot:141775_1
MSGLQEQFIWNIDNELLQTVRSPNKTSHTHFSSSFQTNNGAQWKLRWDLNTTPFLCLILAPFSVHIAGSYTIELQEIGKVVETVFIGGGRTSHRFNLSEIQHLNKLTVKCKMNFLQSSDIV